MPDKKLSILGAFLVLILAHLDKHSLNVKEYGPRKLRMQTAFIQCNICDPFVELSDLLQEAKLQILR